MIKVEPVPWRGIRPVEKLILIVLPLAAVAVLILPFLDQVILRRLARLPGMRPVIAWLINGANVWLLGAALLLLLVLFVALVRRRLVNNKQLWFGTGCPQCMERELVRVTRQASDRYYGLIGVPAYRYACRNCTWRGLRIARREHSPEYEAELEASLLRFDPDGVPPPAAPPHETDPANDLAPAADVRTDLDAEHVVPDDVSQVGFDSYEDQEPDEAQPANHHADSEPADEMEWLWRRSSD